VIFLLLEAVLYRSVQSIQQGEEGTEIEAGFGMVFEAVLSIFLAVGPYRIVRTADCWHTFQGAVLLGRPYSNTNLARISRQKLWDCFSML
jgi:hypothetical protein